VLGRTPSYVELVGEKEWTDHEVENMGEISRHLDRNPDVGHSSGSSLRSDFFPSGEAEPSVRIFVAAENRPVAADRKHMKSCL